MNKLTVFLEHPDQIPLFNSYDLHTLIVDLPGFSIRSFTNYSWTLDELIAAKETINSKYFCLNLDGLYSDSELAIIASNISDDYRFLFNAIRIQDPGLIQWVRSFWPTAKIQFNSETGNQHSDAIETLFKLGIDQITLAHDIPYQTIQLFLNNHNNLEIFVQGNILIQYSRRKFISDKYEIADDQPLSFIAEDDDLPNRNFTFLNTNFGHFMFAHFQRCLAEYTQKLALFSSLSWLIDTRGESENYLKTCLYLYSKLSQLPEKEIDELVNKLSEMSKKPQRPSFFLSNNTDYDWRDNAFDQNQSVGRIVSVKKPDFICVQLFDSVSPNTIFICSNPDQTTSEFALIDLINANNGCQIDPLDIYFMPWRKGIQTKAQLYIKNP